MARTAKELALLIHTNMVKEELGDLDGVDGVDGTGAVVEKDENEATFGAIKYVDKQIPGRRGPGSVTPVGHFQYEIRVTRKWVPFNDE